MSDSPLGLVHRALLVQGLAPRQTGDRISARCPTHEDRRPSLSVAEGDDGRALLRCHAGCSFETVMAGLGLEMADAFAPGPPSTPGRRGKCLPFPADRPIRVRYPYHDEHGKLLFEVVRFADDVAGAEKCRPYLPGTSNPWGRLNGIRRPLYRFPELLSAIKAGRTIFLPEGEGDVESLRRIGLDATTNPGGANGWKQEYAEFFHGADVVKLSDNDPAGSQHTETVVRSLLSVARRVRVVEFPELPKKGDVSDWLTAGHTREDLERRVEKSPDGLAWLQEYRREQGRDADGADLPLSHAAQPGRPVIRISGGQLTQIVDRAEEALLASGGAEIFQRGGLLVRVIRLESPTARHRVHRSPGTLVINPVEVPYFVERFTAAASWQKFDGRAGSWVDADCPEKIAKIYLARTGDWRARPLLGIIEAPTLRPDGSVFSRPGYDDSTGLYLDPGNTIFLEIPDQPSKDDAVEALGVFKNLLSGFPFVSDSDRAAAISGILTALVRKSIKSAPLHAFRAPKMRSGKTLLADCVALVATGRPCAVMSQNVNNPDEEKKRLLAVLLAGDPVICYDNVERPFGGAAICQALTQQQICDRLLGVSRMATVPTAATFLATGNNLIFEADITSRVVPCDLDPRTEHPEERVFDVDLYDHIPAHRGEIVRAGLTILRAYHLAERPAQDLPNWGGFEEWSGWVRSPIVWLGMEDPAKGRARLEELDPVRRTLIALLTAWYEAFQARILTANEVVKAAMEPHHEGLRGVLNDVAANPRGEINVRRLGNLLLANENRIEGGLRVERMGSRSGVALWRVVKVESQEPMGLVGFMGLSSPPTRECHGRESDVSKNRGEPIPQNPRNPRDEKPCYACGGTDFWLNNFLAPVCRRCHPTVREVTT